MRFGWGGGVRGRKCFGCFLFGRNEMRGVGSFVFPKLPCECFQVVHAGCWFCRCRGVECLGTGPGRRLRGPMILTVNRSLFLPLLPPPPPPPAAPLLFFSWTAEDPALSALLSRTQTVLRNFQFFRLPSVKKTMCVCTRVCSHFQTLGVMMHGCNKGVAHPCLNILIY